MGYFKNLDIQRQEQENPLCKYPLVEAFVEDLRAIGQAVYLKVTTDDAIQGIARNVQILGPEVFCQVHKLDSTNFMQQFNAFLANESTTDDHGKREKDQSV